MSRMTVLGAAMLALCLAISMPALAGDVPAPEKPPVPADDQPKAGGDGNADPKKPDPVPEPKISEEEELKRIKEYRRHPDRLIEVLLKRGSVLPGVARKGVLVEMKQLMEVEVGGRKEEIFVEVTDAVLVPKPDAKAVLVPDKAKKGMGVRVWYYRDMKGYMFIDLSDVAEIRIVRELSYFDSIKLFQQIEERERKVLEAEKQARAEEERREALKVQMEAEEREKEMAKKMGLDAAEAEKRKKAREEILGKFPPGSDWNSDKKIIIRNKMIKGVAPTDEEKEFLRRFDEWDRAVKEMEYIRSGKSQD